MTIGMINVSRTSRLVAAVVRGQQSFSLSTSCACPAGDGKSFKLVVVGGGAGGCAVAAKFASKLGSGHVAVVEPNSTHYYQPMWTLVGGGVKQFKNSAKAMLDVLPKKAQWFQHTVASFDPDNNRVALDDGRSLSYEFLVVAMGIQTNYHLIKGLTDALDTPGVCSNYHHIHVMKTYPSVCNFKSGNAIFTLPNTPIKCAGAPQKIMYLTDYNLRKMGKRDKAKVLYHTSLPVIFGVKKYADALWNVVKERDIEVTLRSNLVEVCPDKREAVFENLDKPGEKTSISYEMLHVTPPMGTPEALKSCKALTDAAGYLDVNKETLQHTRYANVFGVGDCTNVPTSKTAAAIAGSMRVLRRNLKAAMDGETLPDKYDGYTSCPLVISPSKCILAEFDFASPPQPLETLPVDQSKPRRSAYLLKSIIMPQIYWLMTRGYWEGPKYIRKLLHLGMSR